jgi:hypothetical protein
MSDERPDYVSKSNRQFLEKVLGEHTRVESFDSDGDRTYTVVRNQGDTLRIYLTGKYTFGILDYYELRANHPTVDCIVAASPYLSYTRDAKEAARGDCVGLFTMKEFLGALNYTRVWEYEPRS